MAFGFPPKYSTYVPATRISTGGLLVLALEAAEKLDWEIIHTGETGFIALQKVTFARGFELSFKIENDIATVKSAFTGNQTLDWGANKKKVDTFITALDEIRDKYTKEELIEKYIALKNTFSTEDASEHQAQFDMDGMKDFFIPRKGFAVTPILIDLNILVFIVMVASGVNFFSPTSASLLQWGANLRLLTLDGQWWRLITCCFLHIGILHLLLNMYALLYIGMLLEPRLGALRFAAAYLLTGVVASMASLYWHSNTVSAGASGAIFGMYGVFLAMLTTNSIEKSVRQRLLASIAFFVFYNLVYGMQGGIDNAAHIGGLLSGVVTGYVFYFSLKQPDNKALKFGGIGLMALLIVAGSSLAYTKIPNPLLAYEKNFESFGRAENAALRAWGATDTGLPTARLDSLKAGLQYWNECAALTAANKKLELPEAVEKINNGLDKYVNLRIASYEVMYKRMNENTHAYDDSITYYNQQIKKAIDDLGGGKKKE